MSFFDLDITTDPTELVNNALDQINELLEANGLPGWNPQSGAEEVILLDAVADIAADIDATASTVQSAIFRTYGTQIVGIPYQNGTKASVSTSWTFTSAAPAGGYLIGAGTAVLIDGLAFYVQDDVNVPAGSVSTTVQLAASDIGTDYNGLGGINVGAPDVQPNDQIDWVASVSTASQTSGGTDQEDDDTYQDRLVAALQLQAPRPITAADFSQFVLSDIAANATGIAAGRATAIDGYYPGPSTAADGARTPPTPLTLTGSLTSGSPNVTVTAPPYPFSVPFAGASVTGAGIPASATVLASPAPSSTAFTMSGNATAAETGETITVSAWQNVERCVTVFVTDAEGNALSNAQMSTLQSWLDSYREVNFLVYVEPPSYNEVFISAQVHVTPDYLGAESTVEANVQAALINYLSPLTWGNLANQGNVNQWLNSTNGFNVVRFNSLIGVIENVQGVQYLVNSSLKLGLNASPTGTADVLLGGPAPLPMATTSTVLISADN